MAGHALTPRYAWLCLTCGFVMPQMVPFRESCLNCCKIGEDVDEPEASDGRRWW
jgi:hypothetical protein